MEKTTARYIDAEGLNLYDNLFMSEDTINKSGVYVRYRAVENLIKNAPTADVEEVVRCEDCRYCVGLFSCKKNEEQLRRCQRFGLNLIDGNGYCFWGERNLGKNGR